MSMLEPASILMLEVSRGLLLRFQTGNAGFLLLALSGLPDEVSADRPLGKRVEVRKTVEVRSGLVFLSDLLPEGSPAVLRNRAQELVLGRAPSLGRHRSLTREQLEHKLRHAPDLLRKLRIPPRVTIRRSSRRLTRTEILQAIRSALESNRFPKSVLLAAQDLRLSAPVWVTKKDPGLQVTKVEFDPVQEQTRFRLWASKEEGILPFYVMTPLSPKVPALVAQRDLDAGEKVKPADFKLEERVVAHFQDNALLSPAQLAGHRARNRIRAGQTVNPRMFLPPLLVEPGKPATMVAEGRGFRIRITVMPLQPGTRGQRIRVRSLATNRVFVAEVVGRGFLRKSF